MRPNALPGSVNSTRLERDVLRHSGRQLAEVLRLSRGADPDQPSWIDDVVRPTESFQRLESELAKGRGAIIVTAHLGNWELLCAWLRRRGLGGAVVGKTQGDDDWLVRVRRGYGVRTLGQDTPAKEMLRVLKDGGVLGLLCDLEVRRLDGEFLPLLGLDALTMTAPAALARTVRAPLIPVRCVAVDNTHYELSVDEPLNLNPALDRDAARTDLLRRLNDTYGRWIRETPEQWAWHQPRWRTRPGEWDAVPNAEWRRLYG
jgi:Kdo2-lipid IVA lauroyltransferase/acyltransferase